MTAEARERWRVLAPVCIAAAAAWAAIAGGLERALPGPDCCDLGARGGSFDALAAAGTWQDGASLLCGWSLMLAGMMLPMLAAPIRHVRDRSLDRRRARAVAIFVSGYFATWTIAGAFILWIVSALAARPGGSVAPAAASILMAAVWQCSPLKQRCLNQGHAHGPLAAFGPAADRAALRFGLDHGIWCVGSCWALMVVPYAWPDAHVVAMAAVTAWVLAERLERPAAPRWQLRWPRKVVRSILARALRLEILVWPRPGGRSPT